MVCTQPRRIGITMRVFTLRAGREFNIDFDLQDMFQSRTPQNRQSRRPGARGSSTGPLLSAPYMSHITSHRRLKIIPRLAKIGSFEERATATFTSFTPASSYFWSTEGDKCTIRVFWSWQKIRSGGMPFTQLYAPLSLSLSLSLYLSISLSLSLSLSLSFSLSLSHIQKSTHKSTHRNVALISMYLLLCNPVLIY